MIISLIIVIISLSTIGADRYHPSFNTKQLNGLDTRTNVKPHQTTLQFCNKLWTSAKILPFDTIVYFCLDMYGIFVNESYHRKELAVRTTIPGAKKYQIYPDQIYQKIQKQKSQLDEIKLAERLLTHNIDTKTAKQNLFRDECKSTWDEVVKLSPPSQARIKTKILGSLEVLKHKKLEK